MYIQSPHHFSFYDDPLSARPALDEPNDNEVGGHDDGEGCHDDLVLNNNCESLILSV